MRNKKLLDAFDGIDASMILEAEPKGKEVVVMKRKKKYVKPLIFAAAVMLIVATLSISAMANAAHSDMEPYWSRVFSKSGEPHQKDLLNKAQKPAETLDKTVADRLDQISGIPEDVLFTGDNDDVMLNVIGVTGAGNAAYVWLEAVFSDELLAEHGDKLGYIMFHRITEEVNGVSSSGSSNTRFLGSKASLVGSERLITAQKYAVEWSGSAGENGEAQAALVSRTDNTYCFVYRFQKSNISTLSGKELTINIENILYRESYESKQESVLLAQGKWQLKFTMNFDESVIRYVPQMVGERFICEETDPKLVMCPSEYKGVREATLTGLGLSVTPIYLQITMGYTDTQNIPVLIPQKAVVVMEDGNRFEVTCDGISASIPVHSGIGSYQIKFFFDDPVDHGKIVAVEYGNLTLPLTAETLAQ